MSDLAVAIRESKLRVGSRVIWSDLSLDVAAGEFVMVIGPNGAGKTSFLRVLLGLLPATGRIEVLGHAPRRGDARVGYVPQRGGLEQDVPLRGRDLVALGIDGTGWGFGFDRRATDRRVDAVLEQVHATDLAAAPVGELSGGEQQRLRIAQALVSDPQLLLCDEPLLNLDLHHQREVCDLLHSWSHRTRGTVVFVTHDVNPVLAFTDRILALAGGRWTEGPPEAVLTTERMTALYGSPVDVLRVRGRVLVLAEAFDAGGGHHEHVHEPVAR